MKAATGELNLTVITLIAIAAVITSFWIMWPSIQTAINTQWDDINCTKRDASGKCIGFVISEDHVYEVNM